MIRILPAMAVLVSASFAVAQTHLDDLAATLLCAERPDCVSPSPVQEVAPTPLVVGGITLPEDADRQRPSEQEALIAQGLYLTVDGRLSSLPLTRDPRGDRRARGDLEMKRFEVEHGAIARPPIILHVPRSESLEQ